MYDLVHKRSQMHICFTKSRFMYTEMVIGFTKLKIWLTKLNTLGSGIVVLVGIIVLVGTFARIYKRTGGNKHTGMSFFRSILMKLFIEAPC